MKKKGGKKELLICKYQVRIVDFHEENKDLVFVIVVVYACT